MIWRIKVPIISIPLYIKSNKKISILVEALTPDFRGDFDLVSIVAKSGLNVYGHNIEIVERLQNRVRDRRACNHQTLSVLEHVKEINQETLTKTSNMLDLGENDYELVKR